MSNDTKTNQNAVSREHPPGAAVQDVFLGQLRSLHAPVTVFLVNGVKLQGIIPWFDAQVIILRRDGHTQLVYKHAISTIMPVAPVGLFDESVELAEDAVSG